MRLDPKPFYVIVTIMAQIVLGPMVASARGSAGGVVFSRNRGGAYIRNRTTPTNPTSPRRTAVRQQFGDIAQRWSTILTDENRQQWEDYAAATPKQNKVGETFFPSGFNRYVAGNALLVDAGGTIADVGPTTPGNGSSSEPDTPIVQLNVGGTALEVLVASWFYIADPASEFIFWSIGLPVTPGATTYYGPYVKLANGVAEDLESPGQTVDVGGIQVGERRSIRIQSVTADGKVGQEWRGFVTIGQGV